MHGEEREIICKVASECQSDIELEREIVNRTYAFKPTWVSITK